MPSFMDEIIREAMQKGDFKNLPGQGEPLKLEHDPHTPEHLRVAHKLMKDNNLAPDWIDEGKGLDDERDKLREMLRRAARAWRAAQNDTTPGHALRLQAARDKWEAAQASVREGAKAYNRRVTTYNLKVPPGVAHKVMFEFERELAAAQ